MRAVRAPCAPTDHPTPDTDTNGPTVAVEQTLILVKPDGVARGLVGEVIARIERKGYVLRALEMRTLERATAEEHYAEHTERPFFGELVDFITSGPLVAMCVEGDDAIAGMRQIMGATNPIEAATGSIRGDFATVIGNNIVHGSDSVESARRELAIFFPGRF
jgi:nucleoside-diphosphate kinase